MCGYVHHNKVCISLGLLLNLAVLRLCILFLLSNIHFHNNGRQYIRLNLCKVGYLGRLVFLKDLLSTDFGMGNILMRCYPNQILMVKDSILLPYICILQNMVEFGHNIVRGCILLCSNILLVGNILQIGFLSKFHFPKFPEE